jgi:hypothetical protein
MASYNGTFTSPFAGVAPTIRYTVELTSDINPMAMEPIPLVDICEVCITFVNNALSCVAQGILPRYPEYQMLIVNTRLVMTGHLRTLRDTLNEGNCRNLLYHVRVAILNIIGFDKEPTGPDDDECSLFQWTDVSVETLRNANLMHVIAAMMLILENGMHYLNINIENAASREVMREIIIFLHQVKRNLGIVIPMMGVSTIAPIIGFTKFVIEVSSRANEEAINKPHSSEQSP